MRKSRTAGFTVLFASLALLLSLVFAAGSSGASVAPPDPDAPHPVERVDAPLAITPSPELLFVAVTPCRIVDTREAVGRFGVGTTRSYYVGGTFGFAPQGGVSGGCGIPTGAQAVSATITAVSPIGSGYVRAWPAGQTEPSATTLNYAGKNISNGTTAKLRSGAGTDLTIKNYSGTTHIVIDVNGYYIQQLTAYISTSGTILDQSGRLVSAVNNSAGTYTLTWDRDVSACAGVASSDISGHILSVFTSGNISYVYVDDNAGNAVNYWFHVVVHC